MRDDFKQALKTLILTNVENQFYFAGIKMNSLINAVAVTGMGVITPIGINVNNYAQALKEGKTNFKTIEFYNGAQNFRYPIGQVSDFNFSNLLNTLGITRDIITSSIKLRNLSLSSMYGLYCGLEAWTDSGLNDSHIDPQRIAIVSAGSNTQLASLNNVHEGYRDKLNFVNPNHAVNCFDSDLIGAVTSVLDIKGEGFTVGAASASGNMAIIQGMRLIRSNEYDAVMVLAPLMDLSVYEYQAFTAIGAMVQLRDGKTPQCLLSPFDKEHCGFIYGQNAGCIILESVLSAKKREKKPHASLLSYGITLDGNRNPNPSAKGEQHAMNLAIKSANLDPFDIDYVNTHGTGSVVGDKSEVEALVSAGMKGVRANSTKSLIGHGITSSGVVECISTIIQIKENFLHPTHNLHNPISNEIQWVREKPESFSIRNALSNSFGFGGINTSIIVSNKYEH